MTERQKGEIDERRVYVETMLDIAEDFSDGAFWGFMEENSIGVDEVVKYSKPVDPEPTP